jgi:hypothetical protein
MQVTVDRGVLKELQYLVALHRKHGAANPFDTVEGLVAYVLACVADGSRRPGAWERSMLESMGLVAHCSEHERYRAGYGDPASEEGMSTLEAALPPSSEAATCDEAATAIVEIVQLLSRAVAALHSVRGVFDTPENRDARCRPHEAAALQQVYRALGKPWPTDASRAAE